MTGITPRRSARVFRATNFLLSALLVLPNGTAWAAPTDGSVVSGSGAISKPSATHTRIDQKTQRLALDWQSFDIAANERVQFVQPNSTAVALNRILDGKASQIFGQLDANGRVILQNAHGILFGRTARIDTGSLIATSLHVDLAAFERGDAVLVLAEDAATAGQIINQGIINAATGGSVALIGGAVNNEGLITARLGRVDLATGAEAVLTFDEDNMMGVRVIQDVLRNVGASAAVSNSGEIIADGGMVVLSAAAARALFDTAVNNTGLIQANAAKAQNGRIFLTGSAGAGNVLVSGSGALLADNANGTGGSIVVTGDNVGLFDNAVVSANGTTGGGSVLLGGDYQGANAEVRNATAVYLGENTRVSADATVNGNGGKLIVWSDESTRAYGALSARGGAEGGAGGFIETSSHNFLDIGMTPDVTAAMGVGGTWLIDPRNLTVTASTTTNLSGFGTSASPFQSNGSGNASIPVGTINAALTGGATVVLRTISGSGGSDGDVIWLAGAVLDYNGKLGNTLQIDAFDDILFSGTIFDSSTTVAGDSLAVIFNAQDDILIGGAIESNGGSISFTANNNSGTGVGTGNTNGIVFEDDGTASNGIYGRIDAGSGIVQLTAGTGVVAINIDSAVDNYGASGWPAVIKGNNITVNTPQLFASNAAFANKEIAAAGDVTLNVDAVHGLAATDSFDIVAAGLLGNMGTLKVNDTGIGNILLRLLYDDLVGTAIQQDQIAIGNIDIGYNKGIAASSGDGNLVMLDDATSHVLDVLQTSDQHIEIQVGAADFTSTAISKQVSNGNLTLRNTFADGDVLLNGGDFGLTGLTPGVLQIETTGAGGHAVLSNTLADLAFADATNIGGDLDLTSLRNVQLNNMTVGGAVDLTLAADTRSVSSGSGFTYGGVLNASTRGGNVNLEVSSVGVIDTTVGALAGGGVSLGNSNGNIALNYITTRDGGVSLDAAGNVTVSGSVDTLDAGGSVAGGSVLVTADGNVSLPSVIAGSQSVNVQAGLANAGSVNQIGSLQTTGTIDVSGGGGADEFHFANPNVGGASVKITGASSDSVFLDGSGASHTFTLFQDEIRVDSAAADFFVNGALQLLITGSSNADVLSLGSAVATRPYSAVTFDAGSGTDSVNAFSETNNWNITGAGAGSLGVISFTGVENLGGGSQQDVFTLGGGSVLLIEGGAGTTDSVIGLAAGSTFIVNGSYQGTADGIAFQNIENLAGQGGNDSLLLAGGVINSFDGGLGSDSITAQAAVGTEFRDLQDSLGYDGYVFDTALAQILVGSFDNVEILQGNSGADVFKVMGNLAGAALDGGAGTDTIIDATGAGQSWDLADTGSTVSTASFTFSSVEVVQAGGFSDSITVNDYTGDVYAGNGADTINILGTLTGNLDAGGDGDTVYLNGGTVSGLLDGGVGGVGSNRLNGWAGDDVFVLSETDTGGGTLNGVLFTNFQELDGGLESAGGDTITGRIVAENFFITGNGSGTVSAFAFSNIENLAGTDGDDNFFFNAGGISGLLDGGLGTDVIDYGSYSVGATIDLARINGIESIGGSTFSDTLFGTGGADIANITATYAGDVNGILFFAIESLDLAGGDDTANLLANGVMDSMAGGMGTDTLSNATSNQFDIYITADGQGVVYDNTLATTPAGSFSGIENITGGSDTDNFFVQADHTGILSGAGGADGFDLSAGFAATQIDGGAGIDYVFGSTLATTWIISSSDSGTIDNGSVTGFTGLETLYGNTGADTFALDSSLFTGLLSGGGGDDVFNINVASDATFYGDEGSDRFVLADGIDVGGTLSGDTSVGGATGTDIVDMTAWTLDITLDMAANTLTGVSGTLAFLEGLDMPTAGNDMLIGGNGTNSWGIVGPNTVTQGGGTFTGVDNLVGGTGADTFTFSANFTGIINGANGDDTFSLGGYTAASIDGGAGAGSGYNEVQGSAADETLQMVGLQAGTFAGTVFGNIDRVYGNGGTDTAIGTGGDDVIEMTGGSNATFVGAGLDAYGFSTVNAAGGNDRFDILVSGASSLLGGAGNDEVVLTSGVYAGTFDGGANTDTVTGSSGDDAFSLSGVVGGGSVGGLVFSNVEALAGAGQSGIDALFGSAGSDAWSLANAGSTVNGMSFTGMESLVAGNGANTFNIGTYTGNITGGTGDDLFVFNGTLTGSIDGNAGSDTVQGSAAADSVLLNASATGGSINGAGFTNIETLDGNSGSDSITSGGTATFTIGGTDSGTVGTLAFDGFGTLIGGAGNDTFNIGAAGRLTGGAQGNGGSDAVNGTAGIESWTLASTGAGDFTNGVGSTAFTGIESIDGSGGSDTLTLTGASADTITLNGAGSGSVGTLVFAGLTDIDAGSGNDIFLIAAGTHTGNLFGGAGDDDFQFNGGTLAGSIDGGTGSETLGDRVRGTTGNDTAVVTGANTGTLNGVLFALIERIDAQAGTDTISTSGTNTWSLGSGVDQVSGITYTNFESLSAGNGVDVFNINGVVAYALNGNGGNDVFNVNVGGALNNNANGGDGDDTFNLLGGSVSGTLDGGSTGEVAGDTIAGGTLADTFNVSGLGSGTVNATAFTGVERLLGNGSDDTFTLAALGNVALVDGGTGTGDALSVGSATQVNVNGSMLSATQSTAWAGFEDLQVTTSASANIVVDAAFTLTGNLSLNSAGAISTLGGAASRVGANAVNATAVGNIGLYTDTLGIDVASSGGNVVVDELSGLTAVRITGVNVGLLAGGAVSDADASVDLTGSTSATINVATGDIGSTTSPLQIQSPVVSTTTGNGAQFITLASNVSRLNVNAGTDTAALRTATAAQTINQDASDQILAGSLLLLNGSYVLDGNNAVGTLAANTDGAVFLNNGANDLVIGTIGTVSGITTTDDTVGIAAGDISQDGTATITAGALVVGTTGGSATLAAAGNDFTTLAANVQGNLVVVEANGFDVGTVGSIVGITSTGFTAITAGGAVTDTSALKVGGLALDGAGSYTLDAAGNQFSTLAVNTTTDTVLAQAGALTIGTVNGVAGVNTGAATFNLAAGTGGLTIAQNVGAGAITLNADADIGGAGTLTALTLDLAAAGNVSINTAIDTLRAASSGGSLTVSDAGVLLVDSASAATALFIASSGDLTIEEVTAADVVLAATTGALIDGNGDAVNVTAATAELQAAGDIGTITDFTTAAGNAIEVAGLAAGGLLAQTGTGVINIGFAGDYTTGADDVQGAASFLLGAAGNLNAASGLGAFATATNIGLATAGTLTLPTMSTTGAGSTLQLTAADIVADGGVRTIGINADMLRFNVTAPGGATTLQGAIGTLASSSIGGDIRIDVNAPLTVNGLTTIDGLIDILVSNGDATVLDINTSAVDDDSNDITVTASAGSIIVGVLTAGTQNDVTLTATGSITDVANTVHADALTMGAGGDIGGTDNHFNTDVASIDGVSTSGSIWVDEADDIDVTNLSAPNGGVYLYTPGHATMRNVTAGNSGITVVFNDGSLADMSTTGDINVTAADDVSIDNATAGGGVVVMAGGDAAFDSIIAGAGGFTADVTGTVALGDITADGGDIDLTSGGNMIVGGLLVTTGGAGNDVSLDSGGSILMEVEAGGASAGITQVDGAAITLTALNDVYITLLDAGTGTVDITSTTGVIEVNDRKLQSNTSANVIADTTSLRGAAGIGDLTGKQLVIDTNILNLSSDGVVIQPILLRETIIVSDARITPPLSQILGNLKFDPDLEGLAYLDPAIFTAVGNYATDDNALELPEDQKVADGAVPDVSQPVVQEQKQEERPGMFKRIFGMLRALLGPEVAAAGQPLAVPLAMN